MTENRVGEQAENFGKEMLHGINYKKLIGDKIIELGILPSDQGLIFFDSPKPHKGSEALYLVEQPVGNDLILVSFLEPHRKTSKHFHISPLRKEKYYSLAGAAVLMLGDQILELNSKQYYREVPLHVGHQVRTEKDFALTLIVMEDGRLVSPDKLHIPTT